MKNYPNYQRPLSTWFSEMKITMQSHHNNKRGFGAKMRMGNWALAIMNPEQLHTLWSLWKNFILSEFFQETIIFVALSMNQKYDSL